MFTQQQARSSMSQVQRSSMPVQQKSDSGAMGSNSSMALTQAQTRAAYGSLAAIQRQDDDKKDDGSCSCKRPS